MKLKNFKYFALCLVLLMCFIGAVSAAEDVSTDIVDNSVDDAIAVDSIEVETSDSADIVSKQTNDTINEIKSVEQTTATSVDAADWATLRTYCMGTSDNIITLTGTSYTVGTYITFNNNAVIKGNSNSYITGGSLLNTPFRNTNSDLTITFLNVNFKNMKVSNLCQLAGTNIFENCTFDNITTASFHNSILWNTKGLMNITSCNFTNNNVNYGAVTNYDSSSTSDALMNVNKCKFINNSASVEPGAINNCGILNVSDSEFSNNYAANWAGAIHTHTNAETKIINSTFDSNLAGTNGGALYTYSKLEVYNSTFNNNNCTTNNSGGAIGAYSYSSTYNITIDNCIFTNNVNLDSNGRGGAIAALNLGYLTVSNSNFTNNLATTGQAIAAVTDTVENGTEGDPILQIYNNRFVNHTGSGDTVVISGNDYLFENNTFINSVQTVIYTGNGNTYASASSNLNINTLKSNKKNVLKDEASITITPDSNIQNELYKDIYLFYFEEGIYNLGGFDTFSDPMEGRNRTFIAKSNNVILNKLNNIFVVGTAIPNNVCWTFINFTINGSVEVNGNIKFINCTFSTDDIKYQYYFNTATEREIVETAGYAEYGEEYEVFVYDMTFKTNFENCTFKDINSDNGILKLYKRGLFNFTNCNFENITADSIVLKVGDFIHEDGIYFYDCDFSNINVNGLVDIPNSTSIDATNVGMYCSIENSKGELANASSKIITIDTHQYVNSTAPLPKSNVIFDIGIFDEEGDFVSADIFHLASENVIIKGDIFSEAESIAIYFPVNIYVGDNKVLEDQYFFDEEGNVNYIDITQYLQWGENIKITVKFEKTDEYYVASEDSTTIKAYQDYSEINIDVVDVLIGNQVIININATDAEGNILGDYYKYNISIIDENDNVVYFNVSNGSSIITISSDELGIGEFRVFAELQEYMTYDYSSDSSYFIIGDNSTYIRVYDDVFIDTEENELVLDVMNSINEQINGTLNIKIIDSEGNTVYENESYSIEYVTVYVDEDYEGKCIIIPIDLSAGKYDLIIEYADDESVYDECIYYGSINVLKSTNLTIDTEDVIKGESAQVNIAVIASDDSLVSGEKVLVYVWDKTGELIIDAEYFALEDGKASFTIDNVDTDFLIVNAIFEADGYYDEEMDEYIYSEYAGSSAYGVIKTYELNSPAIIKLESDYESGLVIATLTDSDNNTIANGNLTVFINGEESTIVTDENGSAKIPVNGNATVDVSYVDEKGIVSKESIVLVENNNTVEVEVPVEVPVVANGNIDVVSTDNGIEATLTDSNGTAIANATIVAVIDGVESNLTTDENGTVPISISGNSTVKLTYVDPVNNATVVYSTKVLTNTVEVEKVVNNTVIEYVNVTVPVTANRTDSMIVCSNMTTTAVFVDGDGRVGEYFVVTLKDANGNPLAGKAIKIGFNAVVYDRVTDENGSAKLQINLKNKGVYTFAIGFIGDDNYTGAFEVAKITVNTQKASLTVPAKTYKASAKTKTLTATLKSASGKAIGGKKVSFSVNGKTYTATTNNKGVATVKVSLSTKKTYSFTAKFAGDNMFAAVTKTGKVTIK